MYENVRNMKHSNEKNKKSFGGKCFFSYVSINRNVEKKCNHLLNLHMFLPKSLTRS